MIDAIPKLLVYMVQGYIFMSVYNFILFKKNSLNHIFFKSVVVSYVLKVLFDSLLQIIPGGQVNGTGYVPLLFIFSAFLGYLSGIISQQDWFNRFLLAIDVRRTTNSSIWRDVIKPHVWVMYYCKDRGRVYYGQYKYGEEFEREPIIALVKYQVMDMDGNITEDNSDDESQVVMLNTKDFERIELTYERQYYKNNTSTKDIAAANSEQSDKAQ